MTSPPPQKRLSPPEPELSLQPIAQRSLSPSRPAPTPPDEHALPEDTETTLHPWSSPSPSPLPSPSPSLLPSQKGFRWSTSSIPSFKSRLHLRGPRTLSPDIASPDSSYISERSLGDELVLPVFPPSGSLSEYSIDQSPRPEFKRKHNKWSFPSGNRETLPNLSQEAHREILALDGESIASRHNIGNASIDGDFFKIEYGQFEGRPACSIIVDLNLVYNPGNIISRARIEFQFGNTDTRQTPSANEVKQRTSQITKSPISKKFTPHDLKGLERYVKIMKHSNIKPELSALSFKVGTGGGGREISKSEEHRWHVQGRTEQHNGIYDTFGWNIYENAISEDSVPRNLRLGMIVFHEDRSFWVNTTVDGSIRAKVFPTKATQEKRWFDPPSHKDIKNHLLSEETLKNHVNEQNNLIDGVASTIAVERYPFTLTDYQVPNSMTGNGGDGGKMDDLLSMADGEDVVTDVDDLISMVDGGDITADTNAISIG